MALELALLYADRKPKRKSHALARDLFLVLAVGTRKTDASDHDSSTTASPIRGNMILYVRWLVLLQYVVALDSGLSNSAAFTVL